MTSKTIAFFNWVYPGGGAETVTRHLARFFNSHGYRCIVYAGKLADYALTSDDTELVDIRVQPLYDHPTHPENTAFLVESLRREKVDYFIVQGNTDLPFAAIRSNTDCRIIFCLHNVPLWETYFQKKRKSSEIRNPTLARRLEFLLLRKPIYHLTRKLENRLLREYAAILPDIDRMVMLCPQYHRDMEDLIRRSGYPGSDAPAEKFTSIINPLLPVQEPTRTEKKEKIVLYVGRLVKIHKCVDRLLKIWQRIERLNPDWKLIIVGTGAEEADLKKLAEKLGLQRAEFAGYQSDVSPYFRRASFCCLTSNFEGLPMCLMEGQQYGVIPVSFDSYAGIREITCNGECGIMVPSYDLGKYAMMLSNALSDAKLQMQMRERSYEAARRYELERIGRQWLQLFEQL